MVGGWAGGEAALKAGLEKKEKTPEPAPKPYPAPKPKPGAEPIYVGFGKEPEEFKLRNSGAQGRVIYDSAEKYPAKEDVGFLGECVVQEKAPVPRVSPP